MPRGARDGSASAQRWLVLVVDDEEELLTALRLALEPKGFDVIAESNPFAAVRLAAIREPDVVVMDLDMPGMDGLEAARHLKRIEQTGGIPVIAFTGRALGSIDHLERYEFERVIEKAGGFEPLEAHIEQLLSSAKAHRVE
jgi:CheY-like chemotaxis protein